MSYPYGPPQQPPPWQPPHGQPPQWRPPPPRPPRPPVSGTANAALLIAILSIPAGLFALLWIPVAFAVDGPLIGFSMMAALVLLPQILGYLTLREIREGTAHPISRQRAVLAMAISGLYLLLASGIFATWLAGA